MVLDLMDEIDGANFFDQIDDLIEFPSDDNCGIGGNTVGSCDLKDFPSIWSYPFPEPDPLFLGDVPSDISTELSVPYKDIVQLEWLSTFVEDSFSGWGLTIGKYSPCMKNNGPSHNHFQSSSPVSVLESSTSSISSCSSEKAAAFIPNHARNKKPRPTTFSTRPDIQAFKNPHSPVFDPKSENFTESALGPTQPEQKMKKRKIRGGPPTEWDKGLARKCTHCEITKTPQWRAGPMGPKTLCNACGVRYKSGRLFPEYRPAASPAFVPTLHSNSHKKVLEMRCKGGPVAMDAVSRASKLGLSRSPG